MKETPQKKVYAKLRVGRVRLNVVQGVSPAWARNLVAAVVEDKFENEIRHEPPPGWKGQTAVKVYRRRPKHNALRLLRASRAVQEASGYRVFLERGLVVPELVLWGESRRWGFFEFGIVVTRWVDAPTVADAYTVTGQTELLLATAEELALIHKAGLAHGDPYARNFLATRPRPMPLDVASWSWLGTTSQIKDLTRFTCSLIKLTDDLNQAQTTLRHYERSGQPLPASVDELIRRAIAYAKRKKIRA